MKSIPSDKNFNEILTSVEKTLNELKIDIKDVDKTNLIITAKKSGNLLSFGNIVYISLKKNKKGYRIYIDSESAALLQIIDWGTNEDIENDIINVLKKYI